MVVRVKPPALPTIWIDNAPVDAFFLADRASVLLPVVLPGLKDAVTPRGRPEADRLTPPVKPFCAVMAIMDVTSPPRARLNEFGEAERAKFGGGATVSETVVLRDIPPDAPVMVTVSVPSAAVPLAVSVSVLVELVLLGLNVAVTSLGRPAAERLTLPLNPFSGLMLMVLVLFVPCATMRLLGEAESV